MNNECSISRLIKDNSSLVDYLNSDHYYNSKDSVLVYTPLSVSPRPALCS